MESQHISLVIPTAVERVYEFVRDPENLPAWAAGLAQAEVVREGDRLIADSPMGRVVIEFAAHNDHGVLDHWVTLPEGTTVYNPLRVIAHPEGAEVIFTIRQLTMSDEDFARDAATVAEDLERLRDLLTTRDGFQ